MHHLLSFHPYLLRSHFRGIFIKKICYYCSNFLGLISLSFVIGFATLGSHHAFMLMDELQILDELDGVISYFVKMALLIYVVESILELYPQTNIGL